MGGGVSDGISPPLSKQQRSQGGGQSMKHRMLRVVQRLFQYQVLLTGEPFGVQVN